MDEYQKGFAHQSNPSIVLVPKVTDFDQPMGESDIYVQFDITDIECTLWAPTYDGVRLLRSFLRSVADSVINGWVEYGPFIYTPRSSDSHGVQGVYPIKVTTKLERYVAKTGLTKVEILEPVADISPMNK
jgi:hypothetical protein